LELDRGVFTISLDFELIWGTLDLFGTAAFDRAVRAERDLVPRLLDLFVEFRIPATWCILGHLFLPRCQPVDGVKHPEIARPNHAWHPHDWFERDPCGTEDTDPLFYGRTLVERIRACPVPQEIGCHSFSHVVFGDPGCSAATAETEVATCVRVAREMGIEHKSFAFPRNSVGHLDVLRRHGFRVFRGPEPARLADRPWNNVLKRLSHLWAVLRAAEPPTVLPERTASGLWDVPGSMIYFPMHGFRRHIPLSLRVKRAVKGLEAAARARRVFHLWFHPTNLADQPERMFAGLRAILEHATRLADRGVLRILPMGDIVPAAELAPAA
jgi:peptidoglycan/xylan/chitin deacetylase (PgdA/CDA1 family)